MKLRELESALQEVEVFSDPKIMLEQYPTSPHIGAHMLYTIDNSFEEIEDRTILDLGTGTGMLGIGAQILGSGLTIGVDIDPKALSQAITNCNNLEVSMDFILADINQNSCFYSSSLSKLPISTSTKEELDSTPLSSNTKIVDTVIMNPPFGYYCNEFYLLQIGTKTKGIDIIFLKKAIELASVSVYSLHKSSTRQFIQKKVEEWGFKLEVLAELRWDIPNMYKFHKKASVDIEVDFIRIDLDRYSFFPEIFFY